VVSGWSTPVADQRRDLGDKVFLGTKKTKRRKLKKKGHQSGGRRKDLELKKRGTISIWDQSVLTLEEVWRTHVLNAVRGTATLKPTVQKERERQQQQRGQKRSLMLGR